LVVDMVVDIVLRVDPVVLVAAVVDMGELMAT
jgi:hypothetical protein